MSLQSVSGLSFDFGGLPPVELELADAPLTSDAGLLPVRQFDERLRFTEQFAAALGDERDSASVRHSRLEMARQRLYGVLAGYEDQNDHDTLRHDPVFQLICDRVPDGGAAKSGATDSAALASQPTLSRFENAVRIADLWRLRDVLVEQFVQSFDAPPARITLDLDVFDDSCHGQRQLVLFHWYYEQYQYLPIAITCAENDAVVLIGLRFGTCAAFFGADDDLRYLVQRLRAVWPDVEIVVRGDSGFGVPVMYDVCQELRLTYTFGIGMNAVLQRESQALLDQAVAQYEQTGQPQRLAVSLKYRAGTWPESRRVVIKCEAHTPGAGASSGEPAPEVVFRRREHTESLLRLLRRADLS